MALRNIVKIGDPILNKKCRVVEKFDDKLSNLIDDMFETMYDANGVGLAAPQVGMLKRVVVIDVSDNNNNIGFKFSYNLRSIRTFYFFRLKNGKIIFFCTNLYIGRRQYLLSADRFVGLCKNTDNLMTCTDECLKARHGEIGSAHKYYSH